MLDWQIGNITIRPGMFLLPTETESATRMVLRRAVEPEETSSGKGAGAAAGAGAAGCSLLCVIIVDPDAPWGLDQVLHGAAFNCQLGQDAFNPDSGSLVVAAHRGAGPPARTGRHRYVAFAFVQPQRFVYSDVAAQLPAFGVDVAGIAAALRLGTPVGVNFYTSQFDGSCWLTCMSALICRCFSKPPPDDWFRRAEAKLLTK